MPLIRQAGAIAIRETATASKVLIVSAKKNPSHWIFPKGHQERGETLEQTAVRELREEAGVIGKVVKPVGVSTFRLGSDHVEVSYFLVRYTRSVPALESREIRWCRFSDARALLTFDDARDLLDAGQRILRREA